MSTVGTESICRGARIKYVRTSDVQSGDRIACWLSDATAYPTVVGRTERLLELSRYGLEDVTHVTFKCSNAPWWASSDRLTFDTNSPVPLYLGPAV